MRSISRRRLLQMGAAAVGGVSAIARRAAAEPIGLPIGIQMYTIREQAAKDFAARRLRAEAEGLATA